MGLLSFLFMVYDSGSIFSPEVLDLTQDDLIHNFAVGVYMVTSLYFYFTIFIFHIV